MRTRKKYWLLPDSADHGAARRPDRAYAGLGARAVHLHAVLSGDADADSRDLGVLPRQRGGAGARRRDRRGGAGGALHAQEARFAVPARGDRVLPRRGAASGWRDVDHVVFYDKPFLKFERLLETYLAFAPRGLRSFRMAMPVWLREKLFLKDLLRDELRTLGARFRLGTSACLFSEHHLSHAASAFFPSPFDAAAVLTHGRRRRVGDELARARARQRARDPAARSISRIRSACSTPRSPTTRASRSTRASTS